jgi:hypothetical protein
MKVYFTMHMGEPVGVFLKKPDAVAFALEYATLYNTFGQMSTHAATYELL